MAEEMYTPRQAADELGVSDQTIYRWLERGLIQATRRGLTRKFYKIPASEVARVKQAGNYGDLEGKATPALVSA